MDNFTLLSVDELSELNNVELLEYRKGLLEYGEEIETYIVELRDLWKSVDTLLRTRLWDLEMEVAFIQAEEEEHLTRSGESNEHYIQ